MMTGVNVDGVQVRWTSSVPYSSINGASPDAQAPAPSERRASLRSPPGPWTWAPTVFVLHSGSVSTL